MIGNFKLGHTSLVSLGSDMYAKDNQSVVPVGGSHQPLSGANIVDWRNQTEAHNNIPPSLNVYIRYHATSARAYSEAEPMSYRDVPKEGAVMLPRSEETEFDVQPQYESNTVGELVPFLERNLSNSDLLLRLELSGTDDLTMKKQELASLLDVFSAKMKTVLVADGCDLEEVLSGVLAKNLIRHDDFVNWYNDMMD
jgi:hypothetical protein